MIGPRQLRHVHLKTRQKKVVGHSIRSYGTLIAQSPPGTVSTESCVQGPRECCQCYEQVVCSQGGSGGGNQGNVCILMPVL